MPTTTVQKEATLEDRLATAFDVNEGHTLNGASAAVQGHRKNAIERFKALGLPTHKLEYWKYTNIARTLRRADYRPALAEPPTISADAVEALRIPGLDAHLVVTVNGHYAEALSQVGDLPDGALVTSFAEASAREGDLFEQHYSQYASYEDHALTALNTAFARDGVFIYVPQGVMLGKPILLLHLTRAQSQPLLVQPRHLFIAEEGAHVRIIERQAALGEAKVFTNAVTEVFVGAHAHMDHYRVQDEGAKASQVQDTHAYQESESIFDTLTVTLSGEVVRNNLIAWPIAEHCETHLYGFYFGSDAMHVDNHTIVEHAAPECFSNELYKGILNGRSTGVFNGRVHVHPDAQKINAYQSNKNVVLTNEASIYSKPELEIYADDVQCSHGSTTGRLDEEAVFYLRSRGLPETRARMLLLHAFASDVLKQVKLDVLRDWLSEEVTQRFENSNG